MNLDDRTIHWLTNEAPLVELRSPRAVHFDGLLGSKDRRSQIDATPRVLSAAIAWIEGRADRARRILSISIPIVGSPRLDTSPPTWDEVLTDDHPTPPSLSLLDARVRLTPTTTHSYRSPYAFPGVRRDDPRLDAYFRSWRLPDEDEEEGWQRDVNVSYTPALFEE